MNKRLLTDPGYNAKRRIGTGSLNLPTCESCGHRIPDQHDTEIGAMIPCSEFHVRCVRCAWPVAKTHIAPDGLCVMCMNGHDRKRYYRRVNGEKISTHAWDGYGTKIPSLEKDAEYRENARKRKEREALQRVGDLNEKVML